MELNYDVKKIEIKRRIAAWARRPDSDFTRYQITRQQAIELTWETSGRLVFPWDPEYDALRAVAYVNFENVRPAVIGVCETMHDVRAFMRFIRAQREVNPSFRWVPRSGGHSTAGYCTVEGGLMLDVRGLNDVFVQPQRKLVHVGPGVQQRDFYRATYPYGLFAPAAICPDVRIGGMMQGGGFGFGSRMFGMNCDVVNEVELVLADGRPVIANEVHNRDLFWAVRGGTGNQFGILTRVSYRLSHLSEVGAVLLQFSLTTDAEAAQGAAALDLLQRKFMGSNHDRRLGYLCVIQHGPNWTGPYLLVRVMYRGETSVWRQMLDELLAMPGCQIQWEARGSYYSMNNKLMGYAQEPDTLGDELTTLAAVPPQEKQTRYFERPLGVAGWRQMVDHIRGAATALPSVRRWSSSRRAAPSTSAAAASTRYIHRRADFNAYLNTYWDTPEENLKVFNYMDQWLEIGRPFTNRRRIRTTRSPITRTGRAGTGLSTTRCFAS